MAGWDGSGNFVRNYSWVSDAAAGIKILASRMDTEFNTYATGLMNCLTRDGQTKPNANLDWNGKKIVNMAHGTLAGDAVTFDQLTTSANSSVVQASSQTPASSHAQTGLTATTYTKVVFDQEYLDVLGEFASNRFTATRPGSYIVWTALELSSSADASYEVRLYKNGFAYENAQIVPTRVAGWHELVNGTWALSMDAAEYVEIFAWASAGTWAIGGSANAMFTVARYV